MPASSYAKRPGQGFDTGAGKDQAADRFDLTFHQANDTLARKGPHQ